MPVFTESKFMLSRFLLIFLVLINFLLLGWFMANPTVTEVAESPLSGHTGSSAVEADNISEIKLLSEVETDDYSANLCASIGPLENTNIVRRLRDRLSAYTSLIRERQTEARVERGFWVYLPVAESREAAIEYASQLGSMGINDYFVVTSGEKQNAVSLGLFNDLPNAERRQKQLQALGFNPHLGARREYETHYWLDYQLLDDVESPWKNISRTVPDVSRYSIQCWEDEPDSVQLENE